MVFHFFRVSAVLLSDLDHFLPILEGPLWACDSFVSGPLLACEGPLRPTDGPPAWQRTTGGPFSEPDDPLSTWEGPPVLRSSGSSGPFFTKPKGSLSVWEGLLSGEEGLKGPLSAWEPSICLGGPSVGWKGPLSVWEGPPVCSLPILRALCRP